MDLIDYQSPSSSQMSFNGWRNLGAPIVNEVVVAPRDNMQARIGQEPKQMISDGHRTDRVIVAPDQ